VPANYTSGSNITGQIFSPVLRSIDFGDTRRWTLSFVSGDDQTQTMLFRTVERGVIESSADAGTPAPSSAPTPAPTSSSGYMMLGGVVGAFMTISMLLV
jgi:hypothetical protein